MTDLLLSPVFLSIAAGVLIVLGTTLIGCWCSAKKATLEADLKMEMIQRGMSADEICQVIQARPGAESERPKSHA
ncbi:MAG TPA: hypothetical protein VKE40_09360 [Gemmataceae bacterium]|nr:hypothetical protein [Gemmataceae bacterium]